MSLKLSTGLRNKLMDTGSLKATMALGFLDIYSGAAPADADAAATGVKLCRISGASGATGLSFDTSAAAGIISKPSGVVWSGTNLATGSASYYRHVAVGDDALLSTSQARIQGNVATVGADLNLSSTSLTALASQAIDYYSVTIPAA